jgi:rhodanese-related sulfurtransferase
MNSKYIIITIAILLVIGLIFLAFKIYSKDQILTPPNDSQSSQTISLNPQSYSMNDFAKLIQDDPNITIIDVRTPEEFAQGRIPKAINIDVKNPNWNQETEKLDKSKKYAIYCRSGTRSLIAYQNMKSASFQYLINAKEGFMTWEYMKLPIEK